MSKQQNVRTAKNESLAHIYAGTVAAVEERVSGFLANGELQIPDDYSVHNSLKAAWLTLQQTTTKDKAPVLVACSTTSIMNALLDMVVQGLDPTRKQCYFIPYGRSLVCMRSYFGTLAVAKRQAGVRDVAVEVVYSGDVFRYEIRNGRKHILEHEQTIQNVIEGNVVAAYAVVEFRDPEHASHLELMTMNQIGKAWDQSQNNPNKADGVHQKFTEEMAKRTVINRALKRYINSSVDSHLFLESYNRSTGLSAELEVEEERGELANSQPFPGDDDATIDMEDYEEANQDEPEPEPEVDPEPQDVEFEPDPDF